MKFVDSDFIADMHPKSWLSQYRQKSVFYLTKMAMFYSLLGVGLYFIGLTMATLLIPGYQEPVTKFSLFDAIVGGPAEEPLFFGIPFYAIGNQFVVLGTGAVFVLYELVNSSQTVFTFQNLKYGNSLFDISILFFSLRTWKSGKGWFAVVFLSCNFIVEFFIRYAIGQLPLSFFGDSQSFILTIVNDVTYLIGVGILLVITFLLYRYRSKKESASKMQSINNLPFEKNESALWYLVPFFFGIIGGLVMYLVLKDEDKRMAKKGLVLGIVMSVIHSIVYVIIIFVGLYSLGLNHHQLH
ncbi:MAG TPA: hypothetical protein VEU72_01095 [Nitrosopumilaceae archaeon]|nr:hypothetical protein [Nitrosopumilaceae archaeon]